MGIMELLMLLGLIPGAAYTYDVGKRIYKDYADPNWVEPNGPLAAARYQEGQKAKMAAILSDARGPERAISRLSGGTKADELVLSLALQGGRPGRGYTPDNGRATQISVEGTNETMPSPYMLPDAIRKQIANASQPPQTFKQSAFYGV